MAEMKVGYKQTEIGIIPADWDIKPIGACIWNMRGGAPLKPSDFQKSGIKVLPKGAICKGGVIKLKDEDTQFCSLSYFNKHTSNQVDSRYTIVVLRDLVPSGPTIGTVVRNQYEKPFLLAQGVYGFLVDDQFLHDGYLIQLSNSTEYRRIMQSIMVGSTQVHITNGAFKNVHIPLPKPEEQRQIAAALSDVDGLIEALSQLIAKKRDMKTAAMQQLLTGKKRLPGFDGEWEELTLGDVCSEINDGTHHTPTYVPEGVPFYSVENVTANDFVNVKYITQEEHNLLIKRCRPETGDILLTRIGSIGDTRLIDWDVDASIYVSLALLKTNQKAESAYVYEYTKSSFFIKDIEARSLLNATPKKINMGDIKGVPIKCPKSRDEQLTIAKILSDMRAEIEALEQRLAKARSLKTGMMQELLTGRTRLIKTNKKQEAA